MSDPGEPPVSPRLAEARRFLQGRQANWASRSGAPPTDDPIAVAQRRANERETNAVRDGAFIREGAFKYDATDEEDRWLRTRQIIERVSPGPFEDPRYLEMLARQAASIELALSPPRANPGIPPEVWSRIIIGTTGEPRSEAYSAVVAGTVVLAISGGMMDFMYQSAKALALAWQAKPASDGATLSFSGRPEDTEAVLNSDPYPVRLFRDTLTSWLYRGRPTAPSSVIPPPDRQAPIQLLINGAERFVLAHEYGHALLHHLKGAGLFSPADSPNDSPWDKEFAADAFALMSVIESSAALDRLPPNMALQGAAMAMKTHEIFDVVFHMTSDGSTTPEESATHPPFFQRIALLERMYVELHPDPETARQDLEGMLVPSRTLDQIWQRVRPELAEEFQVGRPLHPVWTST